ncbi:MAG: 4Fe-4S binding protein [Clostridiales bacterium]|nr:4Fe-4S binding protein [Clostridiales bacterium]
MKKLLILSGKGGTGKTTVASAFIHFAQAKAFADCDVDAPNLHIVAGVDAEPQKSDYYGSQKAVINTDKCVSCDMCREKCRFGAIESTDEKYKVNEFSCEGCGVCVAVCPTGAVTLADDVAGKVELYNGECVFCTAELKMGRGNSGKLVSTVKSTLQKNAHDAPLAIIDGSPGIGCPVIASVSGVTMVLIVTEPTMSGLSDLKRILKTVTAFHSRAAVCVNKADINNTMTAEIENYCEENKIPFVGTIPYDKQASVAINAGKSIAETDCTAKQAIKEIFDRMMRMMEVTP